MKAKTITRLEKLEKRQHRANGFEMLCDDGTTINVNDPLEYIISHGTHTAAGKRLVSVVLPSEKMDGLSAAFVEYANAVLSGTETLFTERLEELMISD